MSDTPRTDREQSPSHNPPASYVVSANFARELERENAKLLRRLEWARKNCRVVFYPSDGAYPIEHAPFARKDMWEALCVAADTSP